MPRSGKPPLFLPYKHLTNPLLLRTSLFQIIVITFQLRAASTNNLANLPAEPDLSVSRARTDFALFAPGVTAVLFVFFVFGTTRTFRGYMWTLLVPRVVRDRVEMRSRRRRAESGGGAAVAVVHSSPGVAAEGGLEVGNGGVVIGMGVLKKKGRGEGEERGDWDEWPILKGGDGGRGR